MPGCRLPDDPRLAVAKSGQPVIDLQVTVRVESFPSLSQLQF